MRRDSTTYSAKQPNTPTPESLSPQAIRLRGVPIRTVMRLLAAIALGTLLLALAYQIPVTHSVDIGGYDSAYVQGFYDPERTLPGQQRPELVGSDGGARWTRSQSFLVFPQAGLPAQITLKLRGWRPNGAPPQVTVLLNGTRELGRFQASADWQDYAFTIDSGLLKPNDVVIEIRSDIAQLAPNDSRGVGVLLDRATYHVGPAPIAPYPPQLLYGALAAGMLWLLIQNKEPRTKNKKSLHLFFVLCLFVLCALFLAFYRAQPLYPYPLLRLLPTLDGVLAALLALRYGPALARRAPALLDAAAIGGIAIWLAAVLIAAQGHVTLSAPSAEKDFRVFALRSAHLAGSFPAGTSSPQLDGVLRADGFYNLGYPLLLWLARPFAADNPFLAARLVAALSGALLLAAAWWLARRMLGPGPALLALLMLALSPLVVEYSLYLGTDMPFAALCALVVALLVPIADCRPVLSAVEGLQIADNKNQSTIDNRQSPIPRWSLVLAGLAAGAAFLIRHPGLLLLPFGWLTIWLQRDRNAEAKVQQGWQRLKFSILNSQFSMLWFTLAFLLTISPQLYVNLRDTGTPLYNQQAKNVWQAVFGDGDWGRWGEANNDIGLGQVIAQDPQRFLVNWWSNLRGFVGTGGEDTREFGQAAQLRLLGFPANWLAIAGLLGWLVSILRHRQGAKTASYEHERVESTHAHHVATSPFGSAVPAPHRVREPLDEGREPLDEGQGRPCHLAILSLLLWIALYIAVISIGLALQGRFLLPLAPIYAVAAAWAIAQLSHQKEIATEITEITEKHKIERISVLSVANNMLSARLLLSGIVLLALLWGGFATGANYVVRPQPNPVTPGQPADTLAVARLVLATLQPGDRLILRIAPGDEAGLALGKYSAIAHLVVPAPASDDPAALRATGARYLIWSSTLGSAPNVGEQLDAAGMYRLYRIQ